MVIPAASALPPHRLLMKFQLTLLLPLSSYAIFSTFTSASASAIITYYCCRFRFRFRLRFISVSAFASAFASALASVFASAPISLPLPHPLQFRGQLTEDEPPASILRLPLVVNPAASAMKFQPTLLLPLSSYVFASTPALTSASAFATHFCCRFRFRFRLRCISASVSASASAPCFSNYQGAHPRMSPQQFS